MLSQKINSICDYVMGHLDLNGRDNALCKQILSMALPQCGSRSSFVSLSDSVLATILLKCCRRDSVSFSCWFCRLLVNEFGLDSIIKHVSDNYLVAIVGSYLASRYIYKQGLDSNEFSFYMSPEYL